MPVAVVPVVEEVEAVEEVQEVQPPEEIPEVIPVAVRTVPCPKCRVPITFSEEDERAVCKSCRAEFRVRKRH